MKNTQNTFDELEKTFETLENKMSEDFFNVLSKTYNMNKVNIEFKHPYAYKLFELGTPIEEMRKVIEAESILHITFYFNELDFVDEYEQREEQGEDLDAIDFFIFQKIQDELEKCEYFNPSAQNYYFNVNNEYL